VKAKKRYNAGGAIDPTRKAARRKSLLSKLSIANDPKTNYASAKAREDDIRSIKARIKDLG
jgi:hypothetical protein